MFNCNFLRFHSVGVWEPFNKERLLLPFVRNSDGWDSPRTILFWLSLDYIKLQNVYPLPPLDLPGALWCCTLWELRNDKALFSNCLIWNLKSIIFLLSKSVVLVYPGIVKLSPSIIETKSIGTDHRSFFMF